MALHRPRPTTGIGRVLAGPVVTGFVLALMLVCGIAMVCDERPDGLLLATEHGLGALMLTVSLTGLIACAALGTGFSLSDEHRPRGGSMRPVAVRRRTRSRPPGRP